MMVTLAHARAAFPGEKRKCARGMRQWCASNSIDWLTFVREGIPIEQLEAKGDALIAPIIALARAEAGNGR